MAAMQAVASDPAEPPAPTLFKKVLETGKALLSNKEVLTKLLGTIRVLARSAFNPLEFSRPVDRTEWLQRVRTNGAHFKQLYAIVFLVCLVYTILSSPFVLFGLLMLGSAWLYGVSRRHADPRHQLSTSSAAYAHHAPPWSRLCAAFVIQPPEATLEVFGFQLKRREKLLVLVPFSILVVTITGMINSLLYVIVLSSIVSLPHASLHIPAEFDELDALELEGLAPAVPLSMPS